MEKIITFILLSFISVLFGIIGKVITKGEKTIFKKKVYFPLITLLLCLTSIIFVFININLSILFFSFGLIGLIWYL